MLILAGLAAGLGYLVIPLFVGGPAVLQLNTFLGSLAALGLAFGAGLAFEGFTALSGRPSGPIILPPGPILGLLFIGVLLVGQAALNAGRLAAWLFPPFHVFAIALPVLMILRFVAGRTPGLRGRELTLQVAYGGVVSTFLAMSFEALLLVILAVMVFVIVSLFPAGQQWLQGLAQQLQDPAWLQDPTNLERLVLAPPVLVLIGLGALLLAPLIEETAKSLGAAAMTGRRPSRAQAFAWGVAAGAGFALVEGTLNGLVFIQGWTTGMVMRVGATLLHSVATGIVALGWRETFVGRRPWAVLAAMAFAMTLHGLWNALALGNMLVSVSMRAPGRAPDAVHTLAGVVGLPPLMAIAALCLALLIALAGRWSEESSEPPPDITSS